MAHTGYLDWLRKLQGEVGQWSVDNFGTEQPALYPLIGAGEEIGELTTSVLKRAQGIDDSDKYDDCVGDDAERDAIGDVMIYLLDTAYRADGECSVADGYQKTSAGLKPYSFIEEPTNAVRMLYAAYGELCQHQLYSIDDEELASTQEAIGDVVSVCNRLCELRGYDLKQCTIDAWTEVCEREWDAEIDDN